MANPKQYHLRVTAGPSYSPSTHTLIPVNTSTPTSITSSQLSASLSIRIQSYRGLPTSSPSSSPYFSSAAHKADRYSIAFSFTLKDEDIRGTDLVFGNDFEKPIRDKLPMGFGAAYRMLRWAIDPGLDGDVYADHPYLYGPLLSSINVLRIGGKDGAGKDAQQNEEAEDGVITEGADGEEAEEMRKRLGIPGDGAKRMKHFLNEGHKKEFVFEKGREYRCDFFNSYLDFNDLSLRLPGITMQLMSFWDGQPLRYVLKHRNASKGIDQELLVITFTLIPEEEVEAEKKRWEHGEADGREKEKSQEGVQEKAEDKKTEGYEDDGVD